MSRNKREGIYWGKFAGKHTRMSWDARHAYSNRRDLGKLGQLIMYVPRERKKFIDGIVIID